MRDLLPMVLALAIWPLLALMVAAQALVADRAAGTDAFLLQRPVPRAHIWRARLLASFATTASILASHTLVWWIAVLALGEGGGFDAGAALGQLLLVGGLASLVAWIAAAAAAAFVRTPIQGVLLGAVLAAGPAAAAMLLSSDLFLRSAARGRAPSA